MGKIYSGWFEMGETIKELSGTSYAEAAAECVADRWAYGHADIAAAGYVLGPEFADHDHSSNEEVTVCVVS